MMSYFDIEYYFCHIDIGKIDLISISISKYDTMHDCASLINNRMATADVPCFVID
jgi:hypothetical protein